MEFPTTGEHCGLSTCKQLDFLPFTCELCHGVFCLEHRNARQHHCKEEYKQSIVIPVCPLCSSPVPVTRGDDYNLKVNQHIERGCPKEPSTGHKAYVNECSQQGCKKKEAIPVRCPMCAQSFCLAHRLESRHNCRGKETARAQVARAAEQRAKAYRQLIGANDLGEGDNQEGPVAKACGGTPLADRPVLPVAARPTGQCGRQSTRRTTAGQKDTHRQGKAC